MAKKQIEKFIFAATKVLYFSAESKSSLLFSQNKKKATHGGPGSLRGSAIIRKKSVIRLFAPLRAP